MNELKAPKSPWLGEVITSAAAACGAEIGQPSFHFEPAQSAIVIVVDGLGWVPLEDRKGHAPVLRSFLPSAKVVHTCLPSTTAAALTALTTGKLPGETRMVGYSVLHSNKIMNLLQFAPDVDPRDWQPTPTIFERLSDTDLRPAVVTASKFASSGLTMASMRGASFYGRDDLHARLHTACELAEEQPSLVYAYWSEIDHAGHAHGVESTQWTDQLEYFDRALGAFLKNVPSGVRVILTADHGMVEVNKRIDVAQTPELRDGVVAIAGEGRAVHVHAEPGQEEDVRQRWSAYFAGTGTVVVSPDQYGPIFGDGPGLDLMGDAVVLAGERTVVVDSRTQTASAIAQKGVHGSYSDNECLVPALTLA